MKAWQLLRDMLISLYLERNQQIDYLIKDKELFWRQVRREKLVNLLEFTPAEQAYQAAEAIIYAYTHAGSREALCRLCTGLFGDEAVTIIDDFNPCVIASISVSNANKELLYALAESVDAAIASGMPATAYAHTDVTSLVGYDPLNFFRLFLKPGTSLAAISIN